MNSISHFSLNTFSTPNLKFSSLKRCLDNLTNEVQSPHGCLRYYKIVELLEEAFKLGEDNQQAIKQAIEQFEQNLQSQDLPHKKSLLYGLIENSFFDMAKQLVKLDISTIKSQNGYDKSTPLHQACYLGEFELVQTLIEHGADVNALNERQLFTVETYNKTSPLGKCLQAFTPGITTHSSNWIKLDQYSKIFDLLLSHQANPQTYVGNNPIFNECIHLKLNQWAWKLIKHPKVDLNAPGIVKARPLHLAISSGLNDLALELLKQGVDIDKLCNESIWCTRKLTPLHIAVMKNNVVMVEALLLAGASPNQKAENPFYGSNVLSQAMEPLTPYMMAVDLNRSECIDLILKHTPFDQLDINFPGTRTIFEGTLEEITRKGYETLALRLKTEAAKGAYKIPNIFPFRCATTDKDLVDTIGSIFNTELACKSKSSIKSVKEIYGPLIDILIEETRTNRDFSLYFLKPEDLDDCTGCYNADTGNELILRTDLRMEKEILPVLFHEITHKSADLIYPKSHCAPDANSPFYQALQADLEHLQKTNYQDCHILIKILLDNVNTYPKSQHASEYLARILQSAVLLAMRYPEKSEKEINTIMEQSIPQLFAFFKNDFLPKCKEYLKSKKKA